MDRNKGTYPRKKRDKMDTKDTVRKYEQLPEKKFLVRNSLLTDLFDNVPHIKTIHHIFVAILISLGCSNVAQDYLIKKEMNFGVTLIYSGFGKFHIVACSWTLLMIMSCLCYVCFTVWARLRSTLPPKSIYFKIWDRAWMLTLVGYYLFCFHFSSFIVQTFRPPPPSACIILLEQVRLLMKVHAFIRTSAESVLKYKPHSDQELAVPKFSQYFYFLFAPTLVFRTEYPRTKQVRWRFVIYRILETLGVIVCLSFTFNRFFIPAYSNFGLKSFTRNEIIVSIVEHSLPGMLIYVCGFFLLLHSLQNTFAELLCFGDRLFYRDWWNCRSYSEFFRNWNIIVHDWLYTYVYKDMHEHVAKNKALTKFVTFMLSAVVHEWVLTHMFGFFFPGVFIFFMFSAVISIVNIPDNTIFNVIFWMGLVMGCGVLVSGYTLEYFARSNLPPGDGSLRDFLLPRFLTCDYED